MLADAPAGRFDCDADVAAVQPREEKLSSAIIEKMPRRPDLICRAWLCTVMEGSDGSGGEKEAGDAHLLPSGTSGKFVDAAVFYSFFWETFTIRTCVLAVPSPCPDD